MVFRFLLLSVITISSVAAVQGGDLKMRFEYEADTPPPQRPLGVNATQRLIVNPRNRGISNVVVYVYTGRGGSALPALPPQNETRVLEMRNQQFEPHIVTAQAGDTLRLINRDPVGHNPNLNFLKNQAQNFAIPAGGEKAVDLNVDEPAPIPMECNIHPWMKAYAVVLDHPYVTVSDDDGNLVIEDLPEGKELVFRVFHEAATGSLNQVLVNGNLQGWPRNQFRVKIGPGVNDYGTVTFTTDQLR